MRLLTHNSLRCNTKEAAGKGYPLTITASKVHVVDNPTAAVGEREINFVRNRLSDLNWPVLVQAAASLGLETLPPTLTEQMAGDDDFLSALYHILMNVHLVQGTLTCPATGREFPVMDGIPNMILEEEECEHVR